MLRNRLALVMLVSLGLCVGVGPAADDQAYLGIFAETSLTAMPGMASMPGMADMLKNLPEGVELPPQVAAMLKGGEAQRKLDIRLWSPGIAPKDATAWVVPPAGLKAGNKLNLALYRPTAQQGEVAMPPGMPKFEEMTIKIYWGSSPTVRPGQPRIIRVADMPADKKAEMQAKQQAAMAQGGSYYYKPDWTTAHWPNEDDEGTIANDATLTGDYALTTSYTGNVTLPVPANVNFLAPFTLSSPDPKEVPDLTKALPLKWAAIPNALGLHARISGMEGRSTIVIWTSSENLPEGMESIDTDYPQMAEVRQWVADKIMMEGTATECVVPEGIFAKCAMAMLSMVGFGPGAALDQGQPIPRLQTKTTFNMNMSDMAKAAGMMMGPGEQ